MGRVVGTAEVFEIQFGRKGSGAVPDSGVMGASQTLWQLRLVALEEMNAVLFTIR